VESLIAARAKERMLAGKADPVQNSAQGRAPQTRDECARLAEVEVESSAHSTPIPHRQGPVPRPGREGIITTLAARGGYREAAAPLKQRFPGHR